MKTAISMPDELFLIVDKRAKKMNISRSEFIASAVRDYAERQSNHEMLEALNQAYLEKETEKEKNLRDKGKSHYAALLGEEEW